MGRCIYNKEWEGDHPWLAPVPSHPHDAKCKLCQKVFSIAGQGIGQVRSHGKSSKHQTLPFHVHVWMNSLNQAALLLVTLLSHHSRLVEPCSHRQSTLFISKN